MVDNKQLMLTAPTMHGTPPFCIAKFPVDLDDSTVDLSDLVCTKAL